MKTLRQWSLSVLMVLLSISMLLPGQIQTAAANETDSPQTVEQITAADGREKLNFNQGWKFVRANIPEAVQVDYPQSELERWENVDLPLPVRLEEYNASGGKNYQGEAMYRKHFCLDESYAGKKLYFEFEGAMGVTDVWVNGTHLQCPLAKLTGSEDGNHTQYGGYLPFVLDITDAVHCDGEKNVITVLTDNRDNGLVPPGKPQGSLDFSYFGGVYRNVYLHSVESVHITDATYENIEAGGGILIDYPSVSEQEATAVVKTHVRNETDADKQVTLKSTYVDPQGQEALTKSSTVTISASDAQTIAQNFKFENPQLWDLDHPNLYTLVSTVTVDGEEVDRTETTTGIRTVIFSATEGVKINGKHLGFLSGVNRHQEYPYIGYAASDNLQRKDAILYKNAGFQIVRTAHHAQSPAFLDECDRLGILVVEAIQGWQYWNDNPVFAERVKNDTRQMIRRDRNHPCIFAFETSLNESTGVPAGFTNSLEEIAKSEGPSVRTAVEAYDDSTKGDIVWGRPEELKNDTSQSFIREYGDFWLEQYGNFTDTCRVTRGPGTYYPGGEERMVEQANNRLYNGFHFEGTGVISLAEGKKLYTDSNKRMAGMTMWIGIDHNRGYDPTISACGIWDLFRLPKYSYYAFAPRRPVEHDTDMEAKGIETGEMIFIASTWSKTARLKRYSKPM